MKTVLTVDDNQHILVIDDSKSQRSIVARMLEKVKKNTLLLVRFR